ncbi:MAG: M20/M25/M40 family metallo-hydrolase [Bacteroidales bacterium]|nr:M20/M25/M40 family metallo-hydrolase [Bacteroidales bacterium]
MKNTNTQNALFIVGILIVVFIPLLLLKSPDPLPTSTSNKEFSALRAFEHVKNIAQKPHSIGTEEHERVKGYIINELKNRGLRVAVQTTTSVYYKRGLSAGYIHNIIGVHKGTEGNKCVLIVGHYDSQPHTLGAADDGSAVASMLESARALKQVGTFKNDIVFLFTDGEEADLFGARAFINENLLKDSIGILLNIEARGSKGPSITYEVSPHNGWIMREYAKSVPYPIAHSIAYEIYNLLPNGSDFTPFKDAGVSGFNIGYVDDFVNYHSMTDSPENLSLKSLQHQGSYIMGIAKHFGNLNLSSTKSEDVIYFNWIGHSLIIYPIGYNLFFVIIISLLLICLVSIGIRKNRISIAKILLSVLSFIIAFAIVIIFSWLFLNLIKNLYPHYSNFYSSNFYNVSYYFIAFSCLAIAIFAAAYILLFRKLNEENLLVGSLVVNYLLMFALISFVPTGAYLAIVPMILILSGLLICYIFNFSLQSKKHRFLLIHFITLIPVITLIVPLTKMIYITFGLDTIYGGVALLSILISYLVIPIKISSEIKRWILPVFITLFLIGNFILGHLNSAYSKWQPLQSNVSYFLNSDKNEAYWFSLESFIDEWKSQFFFKNEFKTLPDIFPLSSSKYLQCEAKVYSQPLPELSVIYDSIKDGNRKVNLIINSARKAQICHINISKVVKLSLLNINGKIITAKKFYADTSTNSYSFYYFGLSEKELELTLNCNLSNKIEINIIESKLGLPLFEGYKPMPNSIIPDKGFISNVILIKRTWRI